MFPYKDLIATAAVLCCIFGFFRGTLAYGKDAKEKNAVTSAECLKCHGKLFENFLAKKYVHRPFKELKCKVCHIVEAGPFAKSRVFMSDRNIVWLASERKRGRNLYLFVPKEKAKGVLYFDILVPGTGTYRFDKNLPDFDNLPKLIPDIIPPLISKVKVKSIEKGALISAVIGWETDELATGQILYGIKKLNIETQLSGDMSTVHIQRISGLKSKMKYKFKVRSIDLFGNSSVSEILLFDTEKVNDSKKFDNGKFEDKDIQIDIEFMHSENDVIINVNCQKTIMAAVGVRNENEAKNIVDEIIQNGTSIPANMHTMKSALETNITVCEPCHGEYVRGNSHPVNVPPKLGMTIPEEYFVLANGNISCMTCHAAHGSDTEYRLVKPTKQELCLGCHLGKRAISQAN